MSQTTNSSGSLDVKVDFIIRNTLADCSDEQRLPWACPACPRGEHDLPATPYTIILILVI